MVGNSIIKKCLAVGIILLFVGTCIIPATAQDTEKPLPTSRGDWLYVGGNGPGNYTKIQDAINHASWGDTVFVYSGVYYEKITIDRALCLLGESRDTTIIANISDYGSLIDLSRSNITISGFTLNLSGACIISCFSGPSGYDYRDILISNNIFKTNISFCIWLIGCDFCTITRNIFYVNSSYVICLSDCENCVITDNIITASEGCFGIGLHDGSYNRISNNIIDGGTPHGLGIELNSANFNTISNNTLFNHTWAIYIIDSEKLSIISNHIENPLPSQWRNLGSMGIWIIDSYDILVQYNFISGYKFGIHLDDARQMIISKNTFMKNIVHARFYNTGFFSNTWDQNYWGKTRILPKPIFGIKYIYVLYPGFVEFDWHPAQAPYDI